ncbi:MAG TPA: hypothetical protein VFQ38_19345 [Longimicrobiales bacterium]|nr:hypothetical protein [Longimicrobiales bacterium]
MRLERMRRVQAAEALVSGRRVQTEGEDRAYEVARKEANEVRAVLRRLVLKRVFTEPQVRKAYNLAGACVGMLANAIIALENRPDP